MREEFIAVASNIRRSRYS